MFDNKNFLIGVVLVVILFALGIFDASQAVMDKGGLDNESSEFFSKYNNSLSSNKIFEFSDDAKNTEKDQNPIIEKLAGVPLIEDFLGAINFLANLADKTWAYIRFIYNIPSFLIEGVGLDVGYFRNFLNVLIYTLVIGVTLFLTKLIK